MLTSKARAALRAQANSLSPVLMVGKGGVTEAVLAEAETVLEAKELVKGQVLESAMLTAREASDAICAATGADGVQTMGSKFVIYRRSKKLEAQRQLQAARAKEKKVNPVRTGAQARRKRAQEEREKRNEYFKQAAIQAAMDRRKK